MEQKTTPGGYLECERLPVFLLLMAAGGYWGAFTYVAQGGVFCNAQTGNLLQMAISLGSGRWRESLYYLVPFAAYCLGTLASELLPGPVRRLGLLRWDTLLVLTECAAAAALGLLPESAPVQITQVAVNFLCAMQYNTFRQAEGIPMATTFCTNHVRQMGVALVKAGRRRDRRQIRQAGAHAAMLAAFLAGAAIGTPLSLRLARRAIWFSLVPLGAVLADLLYADLVKEKGRLTQVPRGH